MKTIRSSKQIAKDGFWFPFLQRTIEFAHHRVSVYAYVNRRFSNRRGDSPPWVSEGLQFLWLLGGCLWLLFIRPAPFAWLESGIVRLVGASLAVYHITFDVFVFALHWTFVAGPGDYVEDYRRSLAGFFLNIAELAIFSTIVLLLTGCTAPTLSVLSTQFSDIFNLATTGCAGTSWPHFVVVRTIMGAFLVLVVLGAAVGGISRLDRLRDGPKN